MRPAPLHSLLLGVRGVLAPLLGVPLAHTFGYPPVFAFALVGMMVGAALQSMAIRAARLAPPPAPTPADGGGGTYHRG